MSRSSKRRYRKVADRRVWVYSELNHELNPEQIAKVLTVASLEQARKEAEAAREHSHQEQRSDETEETRDD